MGSQRIPLTHERLTLALSYEPTTGIFRWTGNVRGKHRTLKHTSAGMIAGVPDTAGYRLISVDGTLYRANRLAWFYVTGAWPSQRVDHEDTDPGNDRWENLRLATASQNGANAKLSKRNKSGFKGVHYDRSGKWLAQACKDRVRYRLGLFDTAEEAHAAYLAAAERLHGEFARAA